MTLLRYAWGRLDELRQEASIHLFGQSSGYRYCQRCWRRADYRRPLHEDWCLDHELCRGGRVYRATFCEPCTSLLDVRRNICQNCELPA